MSLRRWYVTPALYPEKYLDGPYEDFDTCQARCLARVDRATAVRLLASGRFPATYVPRLAAVTVDSEVLHSNMPQSAITRTRAVRPKPTPVQRKASAKLPDIIFTYSKSALLTLCDALGMPRPADNHLTREQIIDYVESTLAAWGQRK